MTDYLPLLSRAVTGLERNTGEARRSVYDRARQALLKQLRSMNPPLAESEITRERLALEEAIRRVESNATKPPERVERPVPPPAAPSPRAPSPTPPPMPPRAPAPSPSSSMQGVRDLDADMDLMAPPLPGNQTTPRPVTSPAAPSMRQTREARPPTPPAAPASRRPVAPPPPMRDGIPADAFDIGDEIPVPPPSPAPIAPPSPRAARMPEPSFDSYGEPPQAPASPRPFRGRNVDFAKADAQKAMKAKMIVGGTIAGLAVIAIVIAIMHRDRIFSFGSSSQRTASQTSTSEPPKGADRIPSDSSQQASRPSQSQGGLAAAVAQRAVLYEENPSAQGGQQLQTFVGTAVWKTETVNPGPGRPPELGMRIEIEVPDRKMTVLMTIRRNPDTTLPASHTVEVQFTTPGDPFGGVSNVPGLRAKTTETAQGAPLSGLVVRVMPGFFLIGLSAIDADREQNLMLLRERGWLDLPFVYNNGRRAVLVIEKGQPGERVMNEALAAWGG